jgi:hypothetical protein
LTIAGDARPDQGHIVVLTELTSRSEFRAECSMPSYDRALHALRSWLDSWSGIERIAVGMARQGYDLQLTRYDEKGWRATFYTTGMEHSPTRATGTGMGAHPVARDAAGGVGGTEDG